MWPWVTISMAQMKKKGTLLNMLQRCYFSRITCICEASTEQMSLNSGRGNVSPFKCYSLSSSLTLLSHYKYKTASTRQGVGKLWCMGQIQSAASFLYVPQAKNGFHIFKWFGKKNQRRKNIYHVPWKLYDIQMSVSIYKVLSERGPTHSFTYCLWLHSHYYRDK